MEEVKSELERMEKENIISKVEGPTDWCVGNDGRPKVQQEGTCLRRPNTIEQMCEKGATYYAISRPYLSPA